MSYEKREIFHTDEVDLYPTTFRLPPFDEIATQHTMLDGTPPLPEISDLTLGTQLEGWGAKSHKFNETSASPEAVEAALRAGLVEKFGTLWADRIEFPEET